MKATTRVVLAAGILAVLAAGGATAQDCPTDNFPEVVADPANSGYPDPFLEVSCDDRYLVIESNGIPTYEFQQITPNALAAQDWVFQVPRYPVLLDQPSAIPLLGEVAVAVNGLPVYGPNEGPQPVAEAFGDPVYNGIMDFCLGHTARQGDYHYHALLVECLTSGQAEGEPSPVIGYSFDGFPIYGPWGCVDQECTEVVKFESGWEALGDPTRYAWDAYEYVEKAGEQYLDACNGRIGPDGTYRYHATDTFPYVIGCYSGSLVASAGTSPARPGGLDADPRSSTRVRLTWSDESDNETSFQIQVKETPGKWQDAGVVEGDVESAVVSRLEPGTRYKFRLRAVNSFASSNWSNRARATTPAA